ncbi:MAG: hypothetical protein JO033_23620 [Acidobacteriaceae bacterium]|nr:hypothetical protein [Acidobacteriaceae bacterium]MBV9499212.1 hypothetical protein [Acidobacteriaceae bacterium]
MQNTQERRTAARLLCADLVEVIWRDRSDKQCRRIANLEDISLSGVCLQLENPISLGTDIAVNYGDGKLVGKVRYCVFRDGGYFLGVQLDEGCKWSSHHFRPQHLVDPRELVDLAIQRREQVASSAVKS